MAITIGDIGVPKRNGNTFTDLHLDLNVTEQNGGRSGINTPITKGKDITADHDLSAIRNAVVNILTTYPGQRPLNPLFGSSLYSFLGDPIDTSTSALISQEISRSIQQWEPRVEILKIFIKPNPDEHLYEIAIVIDVPSLNEKSIINGSLNNQRGFAIVKEGISQRLGG